MVKILLLSFFLSPLLLLASPQIGRCPVFPADHIWNTPIDKSPVHKSSRDFIRSIGSQKKLKADFGSGTWNGGPIGIPFTLETGKAVRPTFEYADESDPGPYPLPANPPIEGGPQSRGDRHILVLDQKNCILYELYAAYKTGGGWRAGSGAVFDLGSYRLRPSGWTSADAAGLPILPGLVRYEEVAAGEIKHAVRFTARLTRRSFVWPARHYASRRTDPNIPPMGMRFRLKSSVNLDGFSAPARVILTALKKYGMILADNGSDWYISGAPDERWNNQTLRELARIQGEQLEAVDTQELMLDPDTGQARQP
ncbi:MAG: hypothetical protein HS115_02500 [Spirochaetales bacterium]|nr:hypothetical protein [Spirochaetales bacterium]